jgi:surfeit locus 1 family protein
MTSERPRFPLVLTVFALAGFAICCALGAWQLQRADWKRLELARIAERQHAAPVPLGPVLARLAAGDNVDFTRVTVACAPAPPAPATLHMTTDGGDWIARALSPCGIAQAPYDGVVVDRGVVEATRGQARQASPVTLPAPAQVTGVLFARPGAAAAGLARPAPVVLVVESEAPAAPGIVPTPYPGGAADQLQYVGAYWLTWFGLAGALGAIYAAVLWRRYHPKR